MDSSHEQKTPLTTSHFDPSPSPASSHKTKNNQARSSGFLLTWYQELLACITFVVALLALFVTIYQYRDKPSPDWPDWLSLNSIIAIYMVLLKSCILLVTAEGLGQLKWTWFAKDSRPLYDISSYDHATRGPWGAAKLIWTLKFKYLLASLGALVTLLTLLADPAAQQILGFYDCSVDVRGAQASLPRTAMWSMDGNRLGQGIESMDPVVRTAIDAGVNGALAPLRADCLTGNCTWATEYNSLGWSGFCNDISEEIVITNKTFIGGPANTTVWKANMKITGGVAITQTTNFSGVPYINYAAMGAAPSGIGVPANSIALDFLLAGSGGLGPTNLDPVTRQPWADCDDEQNQEAWKCRGYGAARCYIFPSVKRYNATVQSGELHETVTDADNAWGSHDGILIHSLDTECITDSDRTALRDLGYKFEAGRRFMAYNSTSGNVNLGQPLNNSFPDSLMKRGCQYVYWNPSITSTQDYLVKHFSGHVKGIAAVVGVDGTDLTGPQPVQRIYNYGDVSFERVNDTIYNLTQALDNRVRISGGANFSAPALGQVNEEKTCIRIRWAWMAYPATLVVLTLLFFVLMAVETRPRGVIRDVWKSSTLALLYHGLVGRREDGGLGQSGNLEGFKEMERDAKGMVVRLGSSSGGRTGLEVQ